MKIIVTHRSPDLDAVASAWLLKRFLPGWEDAQVQFVPAGEKLPGLYKQFEGPIEHLHDQYVVHVDTGHGALDHHQAHDDSVCATSLTFEYVKNTPQNSLSSHDTKMRALARIVELTTDEDHLQEVYYSRQSQDLYDFTISRLIDGFKSMHPQEDVLAIQFGMECLDAVLHVLERRIWAEDEIKEKGIEFETKHGKALAIESVNDTVLEVAQRNGYAIAVRKDPKHGNIRIKAKPEKRSKVALRSAQGDAERSRNIKSQKSKAEDIDLTEVYNELKRMDPEASWYLHVSKKMLLNGSSKNPLMRGSKLTLDQVIKVIKNVL